MTGGAACIPRIWSKHDQTLSSWRAAYSCFCSGRTDLNQMLALVEAHTMSRGYAACWSFTHGILWKRVCCSRDLLSRKSATKEGCRWKFPEPPTLACELEAKGHLATTTASGFTALAALVKAPIPACSTPPLFHTCVFPWCNWMCAWDRSSTTTTQGRARCPSTSLELLRGNYAAPLRTAWA